MSEKMFQKIERTWGHSRQALGGIVSRSNEKDRKCKVALHVLPLMPKKYKTAEERREARLASKRRHYTRYTRMV